MIDRTTSAVDRFRLALQRGLGFAADPSRSSEIVRALDERSSARGLDRDAYVRELETSAPSDPEWMAIAERLTVGETYFFRGKDQLRVFSEVVAPSLSRQGGALRVLSAGCASGEEPYTLAMLAADHGWALDILGVDVNPAAISRARAGIYREWSFREAPAEIRRHFEVRANTFALCDRLRNAVRFEVRNIVEDDASFWSPGAFDVIFCRNVLMYFAPTVQRAIVSRFARALAPGGYLFVGHAESLRELSGAFELCTTHEAFYYRLPTPGLPAGRTNGDPGDGTWVDAIRLSTDRISLLVGAEHVEPDSASGVENLGAKALELFRREKFAELVDLLSPDRAADDVDLLVLRATALLNRRAVEEAKAACRRALALDDASAAAHYLSALCEEQSGDLEAALRHDRAAIYLDPAFAMPHLHVALLARRAGDRAVARRETALARRLLEGEDERRIALFGGGFGRGALIEVCNAQVELGGSEP